VTVDGQVDNRKQPTTAATFCAFLDDDDDDDDDNDNDLYRLCVLIDNVTYIHTGKGRRR
jgi:hypothetical protein